MASLKPRTFWRLCRIWFRRVRMATWLLILAIVCAGLYVNQIGLPDFLKRPLIEELRRHGVELEFSRLRLRWYAGVVAENVQLTPTQSETKLHLTAKRVDLDLDWPGLLRGRAQVEGLDLKDGRFEYPLLGSNTPPRSLVVEDIQARLRFLPDDEWAIEEFRARLAAAGLFLSGTITNASALRDWRFLGPSAADDTSPPSAPGTARRRLRVFVEAIERMSFATMPELRLFLTGDARDPQTFALRLTFQAPVADTPWGHLTGGLLNARVFPATATSPSRAEVTLEAAAARTPWADVRQLALDLKLGGTPGQTNCVEGDIAARAASVQTRWASATNVESQAHWVHSLTNLIPLSGHGELRAAMPATKWARSGSARLAVSLTAATNPPAADARWAWWTNLLPYHLTWDMQLSELQAGQYAAGRVVCGGSWLAPALTMTHLSVEWPRSSVNARARVEVATRIASLDVNVRPDYEELRFLLPPDAIPWLAQCRWAEPPQVRVSAALALPAWTDHSPDWRGAVWPTLRLAGDFAATNVVYRGLRADRVRSSVSRTNRLWRLPDLELHRPDGEFQAECQMDEASSGFRARIRSTLNPEALRPLLGTNELRAFDFFSFSVPPSIEAEVHGRLGDGNSLAVRGQVAMTNFTFKSTPVTAFTSGLAYSNRFIEAFEPRIWRGTQHLRAAGVAADFKTQRVHITNGFSTEDPMVVTRAIGPKTARAIEPYQFGQPPTVRLNGTVPMRGNAGSDFWVEVSGGPFHWWKFNAAQASALVHWQDELVTLTNVNLQFYGGRAWGWGRFDSAPAVGTGCRFALAATNVDFHALMSDLTTPTNRLEGSLDASLTVTDGNSDDWRSWNGFGNVSLRDGWIWAIPIFGVMSAPLDGILPGLGSSRVTSGSGRFVMTNGMVFSDDLEWRAPAMRLQYVGGVDLEGRVNATVQAELLRDTWLVGRIVSLALWPVSKILEFKVTGTLDQPKAEPMYIPKVLMVPLHPFRTLKELFPGAPSDKLPPSEETKP